MRTGREGLEKGVEVNTEGTRSSSSPGLPLRTLGRSCSVIGAGQA